MLLCHATCQLREDSFHFFRELWSDSEELLPSESHYDGKVNAVKALHQKERSMTEIQLTLTPR